MNQVSMMPTQANEPCYRSPATSNSLRIFYCATISPLKKRLGLNECCVVLGFYKQPLQCFFPPHQICELGGLVTLY